MDFANDFQDWELLQSGSDSDTGESFNEIDSVALVQVNYFSLDAHNRHGEDLGDDQSAESDNPSWIEPESEENPTLFLNKGSDEFWSDSGSELSECRKSGDLYVKKDVRVEGMGEIFEEKADELGNFCLESLEMEISSPKHGDEVLGDEKRIEKGDGERKERKNRSIVWWKIPVELLKYCVFRMSPMLAVSVIGFVILGRRLYKAKNKTRGLEIKVAIDDKKASQVMSRAARLNEAFSIVKRVPLIRPSFPAVGSTNTSPVMSLR